MSPPPTPSAASPPLRLPKQFTVGLSTTSALVGIDELLAHLRILAAFSHLKRQVESAVALDEPGLITLHASWQAFLCRAVHRFEKWVAMHPRVDPQRGLLPPLDVLMAWHSYLLNPLIYEEDANRTLPQLHALGLYPLLAVSKALRFESATLDLSEDARVSFEEATGEPFDPPLSISQDDSIDLVFPCCETPHVLNWPWVSSRGDGWSQALFRVQCPQCGLWNTRESFGVRKLCDELVRWRSAELAAAQEVSQVYLAGTMRRTNRNRTPKLLRHLFGRLTTDENLVNLSGAGLARHWRLNIKNVVDWCMELTPTAPAYATSYRLLRERVQHILSYYSFPGPFSLDLVGAIERQRSFIDKMVGMRWTEAAERRFVFDPSTIIRAVARYHAFLDLMSTDRFALFVPTLDIDLAWHTHQLKAIAYRDDTTQLLGYTPDHNDRVDETHLANSFDFTAQAWLTRFGVPYHVCGCLAPSESNIVASVRGVKSLLSRSPGSGNIRNKRPDLISPEDSDTDATHPSEHNAVAVRSTRHDERQQKSRERLLRRLSDVQKGCAGSWMELQERRARETAHGQAFCKPVQAVINASGASLATRDEAEPDAVCGPRPVNELTPHLVWADNTAQYLGDGLANLITGLTDVGSAGWSSCGTVTAVGSGGCGGSGCGGVGS